jgi:hypothetical protein
VRKIPEDIDQLMWSVAESGDPRAVDEFELRFPDFKYELGKRLMMVRQLRGAKAGPIGDKAIPQFQPPRRETGLRAYPVRLVAAVVVLAAMAAISFTVTRALLGAPDQPRFAVTPEDGELRSVQDHVLPRQPEPTPSFVPPNPREELPKEYLRKISVSVESAPLSQVLALVAERAGFQLEIAPGLDNPRIAMAYENADGIAILEDMGKQLGFTPFFQGGGKVLIVPAVDPKRLAEGSPSIGSAQVVEDPDQPPAGEVVPKASAEAKPAGR